MLFMLTAAGAGIQRETVIETAEERERCVCVCVCLCVCLCVFQRVVVRTRCVEKTEESTRHLLG